LALEQSVTASVFVDGEYLTAWTYRVGRSLGSLPRDDLPGDGAKIIHPGKSAKQVEQRTGKAPETPLRRFHELSAKIRKPF
jgi:hypothetical protein